VVVHHAAPAVLPGPQNRHFGLLSALRAHTKTPYKPDLLWRR
jgi:hypothetical protein